MRGLIVGLLLVVSANTSLIAWELWPRGSDPAKLRIAYDRAEKAQDMEAACVFARQGWLASFDSEMDDVDRHLWRSEKLNCDIERTAR